MPASRLPVLLIHGTAPGIWGELTALLAEDHNVIAYDRRAYADDEPPHGTLTEHAEDAARLLGENGPGPAIVVGWSLGGVIAMELTLRHPELVAGLVLLEPPLHAKRHPTPALLSAVIGATILGKLGRDRAGARRFLRWALSRRGTSGDLDRMPEDRLDRAAHAIVAELACGTGEHLDGAALGKIRAPTIVLCGTASTPAFEASSRRAVDAIPGAQLQIVEGSGHVMQLDAPAAVVEAVRSVLARS